MKFKDKKPRGDFGGLIKAQQSETKLLLEETPATVNTETYTTKRELSSPVMEYDDVETTLLGKLSASDLQGIFDTDSVEDFDPLVYEVVVDVEPVTIQPLPDEESFSDDKKIKRRKSSLKHRKSHEKTKDKKRSRRKSKATFPQTVSTPPLPPLPIHSPQQSPVNPPQQSPVKKLSPSIHPTPPPPPPPPPPLPSASQTPQQRKTTPIITPTHQRSPTKNLASPPLQPDITQELTAKLQARSKREAVSPSHLTTSQYPPNS